MKSESYLGLSYYWKHSFYLLTSFSVHFYQTDTSSWDHYYQIIIWFRLSTLIIIIRSLFDSDWAHESRAWHFDSPTGASALCNLLNSFSERQRCRVYCPGVNSVCFISVFFFFFTHQPRLCLIMFFHSGNLFQWDGRLDESHLRWFLMRLCCLCAEVLLRKAFLRCPPSFCETAPTCWPSWLLLILPFGFLSETMGPPDIC